MGNRVNVELGQNITYAELEKGDIVTVGNDNIYIVAHVGSFRFHLINISTGNNRLENPLPLSELAKMLKVEGTNRRVRYFKNSIMKLDVGREYIPYT